MVADALPDGLPPPDPEVARLRALTGRLDALADLPVDQHAALYDEVHAALVESLESLDEG